MKGTTHFFAGAAAATIINPDPKFIIATAVAALLPDIDHPNSKVSHLLTLGPLRGALGVGLLLFGVHYQLLSALIVGGILLVLTTIPHRGVTHSLLPLVVLAWLEPGPMVIGYATHLILDAFSGGIPLFWPHPKRYGIRIARTNSLLDTGVGLACLCFTLLTYTLRFTR